MEINPIDIRNIINIQYIGPLKTELVLGSSAGGLEHPPGRHTVQTHNIEAVKVKHSKITDSGAVPRKQWQGISDQHA